MTDVDAPERPEIAYSWQRSRMHGLDRDHAPALAMKDVDHSALLLRIASPVLSQVESTLDGTRAGVFLADRDGSVVEKRCPDAQFAARMTSLGMEPGVDLSEYRVGTTAVGTPAETRTGLLIHGTEHYVSAFWGFSCYGHPIIHPITRHLEGVLDISCRAGDEHPLFPYVVRRLVEDMQDELYQASPRSHRRLLAAFHGATTRPRRRAVMAIGDGVVLASPGALDMLDAADHAAVRSFVGDMQNARSRAGLVTLESGRSVRLECTSVDGYGVLIDVLPGPGARDHGRADNSSDSPLLIVGEPGTGRTTAAMRAAGPDCAVIDGIDVVRWGEEAWAHRVDLELSEPGPAIVLENINLLSERLTAVVARGLRGTTRTVVLTSVPGDDLEHRQASIVAVCKERQLLVPLRARRHEIPQLANQMLAAVAGTADVRLTASAMDVLTAQPWPGNLLELRRVVEGLSRVRSRGDITPADIPATHRQSTSVPATPFEEAEREVILAAVAAAGGNKVRAAQALGISRATLYNRINALRIHC